MYTIREQPLGRGDAPAINRRNPITRDLSSVGIGGRPQIYMMSTVFAATGHTGSNTSFEGNAAAWPNNSLVLDSKYGYGTKVNDNVSWGSSGQFGWTAPNAENSVNNAGLTIMYIGSVNNANPTGATNEYTLMSYGGSGDASNTRFAVLNNSNNVKNKLTTWVYAKTSPATFVRSSTVDFPLNRPVVIIATHQRSQGQKIYIDGKLAVHQNTTINVDIQQYVTTANAVIIRAGAQGSNDGTYMAAAWNRCLSEHEIQSLYENPHQILSTYYNPLPIRFIPDFTAELAPPITVRSTYLTTPSSSDKNNSLTTGLMFASSPAHGDTDSANAKIRWIASSDIRVLPGRGGPAWVYGRSQNISPAADSFNKPLSSARWSMLSMLSLELDHVSQITPGHYFAGPGWGGNLGTGTRLQISSSGKIILATTGDSIVVDSVTITPRKVILVAVTSDGTFTRFYLNGKLVHTSSTVFTSGGSSTYQPQRIQPTDTVVGTSLRPWYVYLSALWTRPLLEHEVLKLSQDPFQLFKRPDTANHKILTGQYKYVETDENGRWIPYNEQPAYVNYGDLPRTYLPVNKAHPISYNMLYCTTPAHGTRDAYHQDLEWISATGADFATSYNFGIYSRHGLAWRMKSYQIRRSSYFTKGNPSPRLQLTNYTMVQFLSIEQDNYPIADGDRSLMGFGYANALHMSISRWGEIYLAYPYLGKSARQYSGTPRIPLRKLVAVACVATPNDISFYIDGRLVGKTTAFNSSLLPFDVQETGGGGAYVNALGNWAFSPNHSMLHVYLSATWRRALSANEIAEFSQHPGQIFVQYEKFKKLYPEATAEQFFNKFFLFFG